MATDRQLLADEILGSSALEFVKARREAGDSFDTIAIALAVETGGRVRVTSQTLWNWLRADEHSKGAA